jgi:hypothetical protein
MTRGERRHLLLGNGFSIALFPGKFVYKSLLDQAIEQGTFNDTPELLEAFRVLGTNDFEVVLAALRSARRLIHLYVHDDNVQQQMAAHAEHLKHALVMAIAGKHPERLSEITKDQFEAGRKFLAQFAGRHLGSRGCIYTLNYDLILYWTILHEPEPTSSHGTHAMPPDEAYIDGDDGFRAPESDYDAPYVTWDVAGGSNSQNIHYLHGGLHLYDAGDELQKFCWERSGGIPLMEQIHEALDTDRFPLFVAEGSSGSKLAKILHSGYLTRSYKSFIGICGSRANNLFIYGHSLAESDEHILRQIENGKIGTVFVSIYGDPDSAANRAIRERAEALARPRDRYPLEVHFFDAASAAVWG